MRKLTQSILLSTAVAGLASTAYAADLPVKAYRQPAAIEAPLPTWTGFYLGGNAGYGWANLNATIAGLNGSDRISGFVGGGQLGYNWQAGSLVFGVEGDFQGSTQSRTDSGTVGGVAVSVEQKIPWLATARGRIGLATGPTLLYFTGGGAWLNYEATATVGGLSASSNTTQFAWTIGGGGEWMFAPRWSAKIEYLYIDTGNTNITLFGTTFTGRAKDNVIRAGINYHF